MITSNHTESVAPAVHQNPCNDLCRGIRQDLHDLTQPLTRLQWRLEIGQRGGEAELREAVQGALADSLEFIESVQRIRTRIAAAEGRNA